MSGLLIMFTILALHLRFPVISESTIVVSGYMFVKSKFKIFDDPHVHLIQLEIICNKTIYIYTKRRHPSGTSVLLIDDNYQMVPNVWPAYLLFIEVFNIRVGRISYIATAMESACERIEFFLGNLGMILL